MRCSEEVIEAGSADTTEVVVLSTEHKNTLSVRIGQLVAETTILGQDFKVSLLDLELLGDSYSVTVMAVVYKLIAAMEKRYLLVSSMSDIHIIK